jgi:hypothetical protein
MAVFVTGLFYNRTDAEEAIDALVQIGVARDDISVMVSEEAHGTHFPDDGADADVHVETTGTKMAQGAGTGAAIGGTLGAIAGALTMTAGNLFLPGVGLLATGALLAALAGAGAGGLAGTLVGALIGMGIPEEEARHYEAGLRAGGILVGAHVRDDLADQARDILNAEGSADTETYRTDEYNPPPIEPSAAITGGAAMDDAVLDDRGNV